MTTFHFAVVSVKIPDPEFKFVFLTNRKQNKAGFKQVATMWDRTVQIEASLGQGFLMVRA